MLFPLQEKRESVDFRGSPIFRHSGTDRNVGGFVSPNHNILVHHPCLAKELDSFRKWKPFFMCFFQYRLVIDNSHQRSPISSALGSVYKTTWNLSGICWRSSMRRRAFVVFFAAGRWFCLPGKKLSPSVGNLFLVVFPTKKDEELKKVELFLVVGNWETQCFLVFFPRKLKLVQAAVGQNFIFKEPGRWWMAFFVYCKPAPLPGFA